MSAGPKRAFWIAGGCVLMTILYWNFGYPDVSFLDLGETPAKSGGFAAWAFGALVTTGLFALATIALITGLVLNARRTAPPPARAPDHPDRPATGQGIGTTGPWLLIGLGVLQPLAYSVIAPGIRAEPGADDIAVMMARWAKLGQIGMASVIGLVMVVIGIVLLRKARREG